MVVLTLVFIIGTSLAHALYRPFRRWSDDLVMALTQYILFLILLLALRGEEASATSMLSGSTLWLYSSPAFAVLVWELSRSYAKCRSEVEEVEAVSAEAMAAQVQAEAEAGDAESGTGVGDSKARNNKASRANRANRVGAAILKKRSTFESIWRECGAEATAEQKAMRQRRGRKNKLRGRDRDRDRDNATDGNGDVAGIEIEMAPLSSSTCSQGGRPGMHNKGGRKGGLASLDSLDGRESSVGSSEEGDKQMLTR